MAHNIHGSAEPAVWSTDQQLSCETDTRGMERRVMMDTHFNLLSLILEQDHVVTQMLLNCPFIRTVISVLLNADAMCCLC